MSTSMKFGVFVLLVGQLVGEYRSRLSFIIVTGFGDRYEFDVIVAGVDVTLFIRRLRVLGSFCLCFSFCRGLRGTVGCSKGVIDCFGIHSLSRQGEHDGQYGENRGGNGYAATSSFAFATSGDDTCNRKRQSDGTQDRCEIIDDRNPADQYRDARKHKDR